jgi:NAD(P)-dependent dehydrogenase (short-subunit alcohol dehydrogenase family)
VSADLSGRVVLVTGGTKGLGQGLAAAFRDAGADVMTCARNTPTGDAAVHPFVAADVRDPEAAAAVVTATVEQFGRLDVLVNNAGGSPPGEAATVSPRFIEKIVALNLLAPFYMAQAAYGAMSKQREGGTIINIGSLSGTRPSPGSAAYGAAKAGIANLTKSLAMEWAPQVRVNCVTVGYLETEQAGLFFGSDEGIAAVADLMPMKRLVQPRDVAQACLFLASREASFITGADIAVHGGGEIPPFLTAATHT